MPASRSCFSWNSGRAASPCLIFAKFTFAAYVQHYLLWVRGSWHSLDLTCEVTGRPWQVITTLTLIICVVPRTEDRCLASPQHHSLAERPFTLTSCLDKIKSLTSDSSAVRYSHKVHEVLQDWQFASGQMDLNLTLRPFSTATGSRQLACSRCLDHPHISDERQC